jgi:predicted negative regulator of RcsB-dependent stress response
MSNDDYSGVGDLVASLNAKATTSAAFLEGFKQRQAETNKRVLTSTALIVAGVVGWSAYKQHKGSK